MLIERLSAFLDGDLAPAECARIARHTARCRRCRALTKELRATIGACRQAADVPLPPAVRARARAEVRKLIATGATRREKS
jgi:anti-sigma factor RsiW